MLPMVKRQSQNACSSACHFTLARMADGDLIYSFCKGPRFSSRKATLRQVIQHYYSQSIIALVPNNVDVARALVVRPSLFLLPHSMLE